MGKYNIPEGYIKDDASGLYYTQEIAVNEQGEQVQVVTWYNDETGEYNQQIYPIQKPAVQNTKQAAQEPKTRKQLDIKTIIIIICALVIVGLGIFLLASNVGGDSDEQSAEYGEDYVNYSVTEKSVWVTIDPISATEADVCISGLGDIKKGFPTNIGRKGEDAYVWEVQFGDDFAVSLHFAGNGKKDLIYLKDMKAEVREAHKWDENAKVYQDVFFDIMDDSIHFYKVKVPEGMSFDFQKAKNGDMFVNIFVGDFNLTTNQFKYTNSYQTAEEAKLLEEQNKKKAIIESQRKKIAADKIELEKTLKEAEARKAAAATVNEQASGGEYSSSFVVGRYLSDDDSFDFASKPAIELNSDGSCTLYLNMGSGFTTAYGTYTVSTRESEMDDVYVYINVNPTAGIGSYMTMVFSDAVDCPWVCVDADQDFGILGYTNDGYGPFPFFRDTRE